MLPHPLTKFEKQKYYQNEPNFNGVYSRSNLFKINDGAYLINLDEYESTGTHSIYYLFAKRWMLYYTDLFSPNEYKNNYKIILNYFQ